MLVPFRCKKNTALTLTFPLTDADGQPITGAAGLDSEYSHDGSAFGDCTNEATEIGSTGFYSLALTAAELNYSYVVVKVGTSTDGIMPCHILLQTYEEPFDVPNTELTSIPTTTSSSREQQQFVFEYLRNVRTETAGVESLKKEDGTTELGSRTLVDDGTTFTRGEMS